MNPHFQVTFLQWRVFFVESCSANLQSNLWDHGNSKHLLKAAPSSIGSYRLHVFSGTDPRFFLELEQELVPKLVLSKKGKTWEDCWIVGA